MPYTQYLHDGYLSCLRLNSKAWNISNKAGAVLVE